MTQIAAAEQRSGLKHRLTAAARRLLERDGLDALTLRATAREVGVSHMAPYRHFKDKDELLAAVAAQGFVELGRRLAEAAARGPQISGGVAYVSFALDNPALYRLMFGANLAPRDRFPQLVAAGKAAFDYCLDIAATFAPQDKEQRRRAAVALWSLTHGLASLAVDGLVDLPPPGARREAEIVAILEAQAAPRRT